MLHPGSQIQIEIRMGAGSRTENTIAADSEVVRQGPGSDGLITVVRHLKYAMQAEAAGKAATSVSR
jgi:hypothetical protein